MVKRRPNLASDLINGLFPAMRLFKIAKTNNNKTIQRPTLCTCNNAVYKLLLSMLIDFGFAKTTTALVLNQIYLLPLALKSAMQFASNVGILPVTKNPNTSVVSVE